jgi:hypothetical protein
VAESSDLRCVGHVWRTSRTAWQPGIVLSHLPSYSYVRPEPVGCGHSGAMGGEGCAMVVQRTGEESPTEVPSV